MTQPPPLYWPFEVLPPERQTDEHRQHIRFLEAAYQEGFRPCLRDTAEYEARSGQGMEAWMAPRGCPRREAPRRWEVCLSDLDGTVARFWVHEFAGVVGSVLSWLRGQELDKILSDTRPYIIKGAHVYPRK